MIYWIILMIYVVHQKEVITSPRGHRRAIMPFIRMNKTPFSGYSYCSNQPFNFSNMINILCLCWSVSLSVAQLCFFVGFKVLTIFFRMKSDSWWANSHQLIPNAACQLNKTPTTCTKCGFSWWRAPWAMMLVSPTIVCRIQWNWSAFSQLKTPFLPMVFLFVVG